MEKWIMIGNPMSASATTGDAWKNSVDLLQEAGFEVTVSPTQRAAHAIELAQEAAASGFRKMTVKPLGKVADYVELDGEVPGTLPVTIEVTGQQINIIVP